MQSLFGAVVHAGDSLEAKKTRKRNRELAVPPMRINGVLKIKPLLPVMIVQKRHKKTTRFSVSRDDGAFKLLAALVHLHKRSRGSPAFDNVAQRTLQREIQCRINPDRLIVVDLRIP